MRRRIQATHSGTVADPTTATTRNAFPVLSAVEGSV